MAKTKIKYNQAEIREILTADRTYYVRTDGSDSNNGLANTSGGAFLTIAKAISTVYLLDLNVYNVVIQVGDGTWSTAVSFSGQFIGKGIVTLQGNTTTPANCLITNGITVDGCRNLTINGFRISSTGATCLYLLNGAYVTLKTKIEFGACTSYQIWLENISTLVGDSYSIVAVGTLNRHLYITTNSVASYISKTITLSGTLPYFIFIDVLMGGVMLDFVSSWTGGTITGQRYSASLNGVINTFGGGANVYPGNSAGTTATGGQYA